MQRREFLATTGAAITVGLAGCLGGDDAGSPEGVVEAYVSAFDSGDFEGAQDYVHDDSPLAIDDIDGEFGEEAEEMMEEFDFSIENTEVVEQDTEPDIDGIDETATVEAEMTISGEMMGEEIEETETEQIVVAKDDGDWWIWSE